MSRKCWEHLGTSANCWPLELHFQPCNLRLEKALDARKFPTAMPCWPAWSLDSASIKSQKSTGGNFRSQVNRNWSFDFTDRNCCEPVSRPCTDLFTSQLLGFQAEQDINNNSFWHFLAITCSSTRVGFLPFLVWWGYRVPKVWQSVAVMPSRGKSHTSLREGGQWRHARSTSLWIMLVADIFNIMLDSNIWISVYLLILTIFEYFGGW